ncbi:MAG: hypothetical protein N2257_00930 [Thermodesulfovibrionales bacterium]|nr:hypothetical protein [Thermodesulfovibrionales bacterium]
MKKTIISAVLFIQLILASHGLSAEEKKINFVGEDICPNSAGAILRDELAGLNTGDILIIVIEKDRKEIVQTAIKLEKLPVTSEERDEKNITTFILKKK